MIISKGDKVMKKKYHFELGDLRAFITVVNVMLIMRYGLSVAWFGLAIAFLGLVMDFIKFVNQSRDFRVNSAVMHTANIVLNVFFMAMKG